MSYQPLHNSRFSVCDVFFIIVPPNIRQRAFVVRRRQRQRGLGRALRRRQRGEGAKRARCSRGPRLLFRGSRRLRSRQERRVHLKRLVQVRLLRIGSRDARRTAGPGRGRHGDPPRPGAARPTAGAGPALRIQSGVRAERMGSGPQSVGNAEWKSPFQSAIAVACRAHARNDNGRIRYWEVQGPCD